VDTDHENEGLKDPSKREFLKNVGKFALAGTVIGTGLAHQGMTLHPERRTSEGLPEGEILLDIINKIDESTNVHWSYYENQVAGVVEPFTEAAMPKGIARIDVECKTHDGRIVELTKNSETVSAHSSSYDSSNGDRITLATIEEFSAAIADANYIAIRYLSEPFESPQNQDLTKYMLDASLEPDSSKINRFRVLELLKAEDQDVLALRRRQTYFNMIDEQNRPDTGGYIVEIHNDAPDGFNNHEMQRGSRVVIQGEQSAVTAGLLSVLEDSFTSSR